MDGLILLTVFGLYNYGILRQRSREERHHSRLLRSMVSGANHNQANKLLIKLILSIAMLLFCAEMMVQLASTIAISLNVSVFLIGLFLVAVGTSLPELSVEIESIRKRQIGMALGDLFGSVVANSTLILGLVALINPKRLANGITEYALAAAAFGVFFLLFWWFIRSKKRLERWEGLTLIVAYLVFVLLEWGK
jgi:cation:H+ antiporter